MKLKELSASKTIDIRFSEVDSMSIVWHGNYMLYLEDVREAFGHKYGIDYLTIYHHGFYAPLVDMSLKYKRPIIYGMKPLATITYQPCDAAKIVFDYLITNPDDGAVLATAHSVQVFMDLQYNLVLTNPDFYEEWKKRWL